MQLTTTALLGAVIAALPPALAPAESSAFILLHGADTISIERFSQTPTRLEGELLFKAASARFSYVLERSAAGTASRLTNKFWLASDARDAAPRQSAVMTFTGDSVIAEITSAGGQPVVQRLGSRAGAWPHINPSFALLEAAVMQAKRHRATTFPVFMVAGGQTVDATVEWLGGDSAVVSMPGSAVRLSLGPDGRFLGGTIAAQDLLLVRSETTTARDLDVETPDYSAPAGAPYTAEDVTVPTPMGHTLAGTLTLPAGASAGHRVPAVVTITGSGLQDRDEAITMFKGFRPFRQFADALGGRGIAVLRMDDRGMGGSGGNATTSTSADFAKDIEAGLAYLRARPEIDGARLGLVGHSEGGIIAPMVAADQPDLKGIVLLAGTSRSGRRILQFQLTNLIRGDTTKSPAARDSAIALVPGQIDSLASVPWTRFFLDYDPTATARRVTTPVLILNGATDQQVTPDQVPELVEAFKEAGNQDVTWHVFPGLNHLFVPDPDGFPGHYTSLPSFDVDPAVLEMVTDWLATRLAAGGVVTGRPR